MSRHLGIAVTHGLKITPISTLSPPVPPLSSSRRALYTRYSDCSSTTSSLPYGDSAQPYLSTVDVPNRLASCVALSINRRRSTRISRLTVWQYLPFDYLACFFANARCPSCLHGHWGKSRQLQWVAAGRATDVCGPCLDLIAVMRCFVSFSVFTWDAGHWTDVSSGSDDVNAMGCCTAFERTSGVEVIANVWGGKKEWNQWAVL